MKLLSENYCIKDLYISNTKPLYYIDNPNKSIIYQPDVYELALYLAKNAQVKYIIDIGSGNGLKLKAFESNFNLICIDFGENKNIISKNIKEAMFIEANLNNGLPDISIDILKDAIVICSDVIEHIINPSYLLTGLKKLSEISKYVLISTPDRIRARGIEDMGPPLNQTHVREWSLEEFYNLLNKCEFPYFMIGYTINTNIHQNKSTIMVLTGTEVKIDSKFQNKKILAIINVYNEEEIIVETINHLLNHGIDVHIVDNWSKDSTYKIVKKMKEQNNDRIFLSKFPEKDNQKYEWGKALDNTLSIADESDYDWILHYDADEIRESPWKGYNLNDAISFVDLLGYNCIDFTVLDFRPIYEEYKHSSSFIEEMMYFEFGRRPGHFKQLKCWKNIKKVNKDLSSSGGHEIIFNNRKTYPIKFLIKHYALRNQKQAEKKIFCERKNRFDIYEKNVKKWHTQYDSFNLGDKFIWKKEELINWNKYYFHLEFLVERISGIGLVDKNEK